MATLHVRNLPDGLYRKLKARAKRERRSVAQEVTVLLTAALDSEPPLSILQSQGLGKELWLDIDAEAQVRKRVRRTRARTEPMAKLRVPKQR
ncbi:MAG: hypothetical protein KIS73_03195 [Enhydrobacter sp.]|nr:hypothetical protein [Enhydrobacter sp.]